MLATGGVLIGALALSTPASAAAKPHHPKHATGIPAIESGTMPWTLPAALSREVAVGGAQGVVLLGGLTASQASTAAVTAVGTPAGSTTSLGSLASPVHDAAGVRMGSRYLVFGGGAQTSTADVQSFPATPGAAATATVVGQLPQPRSDDAAVRIGSVAYVVGGYDGTNADPQVLATTNGRTFSVVATLPVPVRYPAVVAVGRTIYAFGGETVGATSHPVATVQTIDTVTHRARVLARLPHGVTGAAAVVLGGHVYVAGGDSGLSTIWAFDPHTRRSLAAGMLMAPVANAGVAVVGNTAYLSGGETNGTPVSTVQMLRPNAAFGTAGLAGAGSPYYGDTLLIADRGNNRMLVLDDTNKITWTYPGPGMPPPPGPKGFYFPDDTFFIHHGTAIITNQEENETIAEIGYPSGKVLWTYGHPAASGSAPGYLHEPDDAYLLRNGDITVADAENCRVLVLSSAGAGSVLDQIGTTGTCVHNPPTSMGSPNGDTPLADGNILVSEINGSWVSEYTPTGTLVWTVHLPIGYPSDPQQLGPDLYLIADYSTPGSIVEFNRAGQILYRYQPASGQGMLNQPSLVERLPSGVFMANDDYRDRMVAFDPVTGARVWQYGVTDQPGTAPGQLSIPDGFDLLTPQGTTPTHPTTG
jgi:outer membrane protein assembly factor BamB